MKINHLTKREEKCFVNIEPGQAFFATMGSEKYLWMKIEDIEGLGETEYNAVCLVEGEVAYFEPDELIIPVEAEVVVK